MQLRSPLVSKLLRAGARRRRTECRRWSGSGVPKEPSYEMRATVSGSWPDDIHMRAKAATGVPTAQQGISILKRQAELDEYLLGILDAQSKVYDVCKETDLQYAPYLSEQLGNEVYLKREDQQPVYSFKLRGAYNKMASLDAGQRAAGIVACSAGNHAQGVALSASKLGIDGVIVMPLATPDIKVDAVRRFGGRVVLHGENFDQAQEEALRLSEEEGRTLVHPFDDPKVICGQGTIGMEITKQMAGKPIEAVFCCVGGGGLLAGVSAYLKRTNPNVKTVGVEARDAAGMTESIEAGRLVTLDGVGLFADGAAVRRVGRNTFGLCRDLVDGMITVSTDEICAGIKAGFRDTRTVFEPAGALGIAGLRKYVEKTGVRGAVLVAVASGANMDFDRLRFVSERADASESLVLVRIPERPGSFMKMYMTIYPRNITEFSYRMLPGSDATVFMSFQVDSTESKAEALASLAEKGYEVTDLEHNEMAKVHGRHLAGGRSPNVTDERLFAFEFPERPGALRHFLSAVNGVVEAEPSFNVSLFHYRNHGADVGRVLVGLQAPSSGNGPPLEAFLEDLGFVWREESNNPLYDQLLR